MQLSGPVIGEFVNVTARLLGKVLTRMGESNLFIPVRQNQLSQRWVVALPTPIDNLEAALAPKRWAVLTLLHTPHDPDLIVLTCNSSTCTRTRVRADNQGHMCPHTKAFIEYADTPFGKHHLGDFARVTIVSQVDSGLKPRCSYLLHTYSQYLCTDDDDSDCEPEDTGGNGSTSAGVCWSVANDRYEPSNNIDVSPIPFEPDEDCDMWTAIRRAGNNLKRDSNGNALVDKYGHLRGRHAVAKACAGCGLSDNLRKVLDVSMRVSRCTLLHTVAHHCDEFRTCSLAENYSSTHLPVSCGESGSSCCARRRGVPTSLRFGIQAQNAFTCLRMDKKAVSLTLCL